MFKLFKHENEIKWEFKMFRNEYLMHLSNLFLYHISCIILYKNQVENVCIKYDEKNLLCGLTDS